MVLQNRENTSISHNNPSQIHRMTLKTRDRGLCWPVDGGMQLQGCTCLPLGSLPAPEVSRGFGHEPVRSSLIAHPQLQCGNTQKTIILKSSFFLSGPPNKLFPSKNLKSSPNIQCLHKWNLVLRTWCQKLFNGKKKDFWVKKGPKKDLL